MKNKVRSLAVVCVTVCAMIMLLTITAHAQVAAPSLTCEVVDNGNGTIDVSVMADSNGDSIDAIRMEMVVDNALTNPVVTRGSDWDTETPGVFIPAGNGTSYLVRTYGRSELAGAFVADATVFATIVFDWNGEATTISFDQLGLLTGEGTYKSLQGTKDPLNVGTCSPLPTAVSLSSISTNSAGMMVMLSFAVLLFVTPVVARRK